MSNPWHGTEHWDSEDEQPFQPLQPANTTRIVVSLIFGPVAWVLAILLAIWLVRRTDAIELGALVTGIAFLVSLVLLSVLRVGRTLEERAYARRSRP